MLNPSLPSFAEIENRMTEATIKAMVSVAIQRQMRGELAVDYEYNQFVQDGWMVESDRRTWYSTKDQVSHLTVIDYDTGYIEAKWRTAIGTYTNLSCQLEDCFHSWLKEEEYRIKVEQRLTELEEYVTMQTTAKCCDGYDDVPF